MELKTLFRILSDRATSDGWEPVLHYMFRMGYERVQYPSEEPLTDPMRALLRRIEYDAIPLVATTAETTDTHRTERLVYHPSTGTYYYGTVTTPLGELDCIVCWYAVPYRYNAALTQWLERYWSKRDTERFLDAWILLCNRQ
jgi:hypothetical protein